MSRRTEPDSQPPTVHWCARCERELPDQADRIEVRGLTYCARCVKVVRP